MKVAAMYHDIGKMYNPKYFTENQPEDRNIHDKLDPHVSYQIITRHVADSVITLINNTDFPREVIEVISQHHGNTVLKYFFDKDKDTTDDTVYRYRTTKPTSVEAMVLMVCDAVEAMARSLAQAGKFDPSRVINESLQRLLDDGQFDDVTMKLGDLKRIKTALARELEGMYQKRVDYDEAEEIEEE
jgi:hypothetical protein